MDRWTARLFGVATVTMLIGCGGISEERFNALDAQVKKMQGAADAAGDINTNVAALDQRLSGFEVSTTESLKKMEEMMEFFQREVSKGAAAAPAKGTSPTFDPWADAAVVLGINESGVKADGDNLKVSSKWLLRQLHAAAAVGGKGPKFAPAKNGGVMVRGLKPASLFDQLGLKNNDVVMEANGTAIASVEELMAALRQGKNPTTLKVMRKKKELVLTYTITD